MNHRCFQLDEILLLGPFFWRNPCKCKLLHKIIFTTRPRISRVWVNSDQLSSGMSKYLKVNVSVMSQRCKIIISWFAFCTIDSIKAFLLVCKWHRFFQKDIKKHTISFTTSLTRWTRSCNRVHIPVMGILANIGGSGGAYSCLLVPTPMLHVVIHD